MIRHEKDADLEWERKAIAVLAERTKGKYGFQKMSVYAGCDYVAYDSETKKLHCWIEIKRRSCSVDEYKTYKFQAKCMSNGMRLEQLSGVCFYVVVIWSDCWVMFRPMSLLKDSEFYVNVNDDERRGDSDDNDVSIHFDIAKIIEKAALRGEKI